MTEEQRTQEGGGKTFLFTACFVALVATSFAFIIRVMLLGDWQIAFGLSETQKGEISGAGMWPFGLSIVLFSLVIDKIGYGRSMIFAFVCHLVSAILMVTASGSNGYAFLYFGSFLNGLAAGTVEAVINPAIASMYPKQKTKMLSILHAGWPGGFVLAGIAIMLMGPEVDWHVKAGIILIPVLAYGAMLIRCKFPVSERVQAGVSYKEMLQEPGALGALIVVYMLVMEITRVFSVITGFMVPDLVKYALIILIPVGYYAYTRSLGKPMYIFLLLIMILLATTELGTDAWIKELMGPAMATVNLDSGWIIVYTAFIMMVLRFCIGPIERLLRPLGVLLASSLFAAVGLFFLSKAEGPMILVMATIYGTGQCFFWPVTLGLVAEQFPRGGALTLNAIAGVGMLGVGIVGAQWLGYLQDTQINKALEGAGPIYERLMDETEKKSVFGTYFSLDGKVVNEIQDKVTLYNYVKENGGDVGALSDDSTFQTYVRNAYDHLVRKPDDEEEKTHQEMVAALRRAEAFPDASEFEELQDEKSVLNTVTTDAKQNAMSTVAILPLIMAVCYMGLIFYFKSKGGYKAVDLNEEGEVVGEHEVTPHEAVKDAEETPSE